VLVAGGQGSRSSPWRKGVAATVRPKPKALRASSLERKELSQPRPLSAVAFAVLAISGGIRIDRRRAKCRNAER
jgi:hypothetical protein